MRIERIYEWKPGSEWTERDPQPFDPTVKGRDVKRVAHLSDTHLGKEGEAGRRRDLRQWCESLEHLQVDVVVHTGDVVESPEDDEAVAQGMEILKGLSVPVVGVRGNHDVAVPGEASAVGRYFGACPEAREEGGILFWRLDSMAAPAVEERSKRERQLGAAEGFYSTGALGQEQLGRLDTLLEKEPRRPIEIAVVHHHLRQPVPAKPWYEANTDLMAPLLDGSALVERLRARKVELLLHGHRHQYVAPYQPYPDLAVLNGGSSTGPASPQRIRLIDMKESGGLYRVWEVARYRSNRKIWG